jgi:hypothetical protein
MEEKLVCSVCIGEEFLSKQIAAQSIQSCNYCNENNPCTSIGDITNRVENVLVKHFILTPENPEPWQEAAMRDKEIDYDWYRDGYPLKDIIDDILNVGSEVAEDILNLLPEKSTYDDFDELAHDESAHYIDSKVKDPEWETMWRKLEASIKSETRFFNQGAKRVLDEVFSSIDDLKTRNDSPAIVFAGPKSTLEYIYRARVHKDEASVERTISSPDIELSPPPPHLASAGRMNPHGISCFYGSAEKSTAISEVRPFVGSYVVVGRFKVIRPLKLIDMSALQDIRAEGSYFDLEYYRAEQQAIFLEALCKRISQPIRPHEAELEYLTTQLVAEYLGIEWDGIIFPSSQTTTASKNVVLFHKASKVRLIDNTQYNMINVRLFEDTDGLPSFSPCVTRSGFESKKLQVNNPVDKFRRKTLFFLDDNSDPRKESLEITGENLTVEVIKGVDYKSESHAVTNYSFMHDDDMLF